MMKQWIDEHRPNWTLLYSLNLYDSWLYQRLLTCEQYAISLNLLALRMDTGAVQYHRRYLSQCTVFKLCLILHDEPAEYFSSAMILLTSTTSSLQLRRQTIRKMLLIQGLLYTPVQVISLSLNLLVLYICNLHQCMTLSALSHSRGHPVPGANRTLKPYDVESTIGNFLGKWKIFGMIVYLPRKFVLLSCHSEEKKWCILCTAKNPQIYMEKYTPFLCLWQ
jgi:hypothetical protein